MRQQGMSAEAFLQNVKLVSSGAAELVKKQARGWVNIGL
jgi:intracellular sulfur oxidation DsrE/DsrF family protein